VFLNAVPVGMLGPKQKFEENDVYLEERASKFWEV
jgi:hypothetical protein